MSLNTVTGLPQCFKSKATLCSAYEAMEIVENDSPTWLNFVKMFRPSWEAQMVNQETQWHKYVRIFRGKSQVPKTRFFDNRGHVGTRRRNMPVFRTSDVDGPVDGGTP
jgi:hypothetical protein